MSRVQLAINVSKLDDAIEFYGKLFDAKPAKVRPGYANFAIDSPALKLVLIEGEGSGGTLNHLGVEVDSTDEVTDAAARFDLEGMETVSEQGVACCYAVQDKVWVRDPDGAPWEVYLVTGDADVMQTTPDAATGETACCGSETTASACC